MIKIVTDSTAYLNKDFAKKHDIKIVPLKVSFGEKNFRDGVDITPDDFYRMLEENIAYPKTSQPSVKDFTDVYKPIIEKGYSIISIHISGGLSGTVNVANLAKNTIGGEKICIVDSRSTALVLQFLVEKATEFINEGKNFEQVCSGVSRLVGKMLSRFILYDLNYMVKGGRLSKTEAFFGSALNIKPIVSFTNGKSKVEGITRSWKKAKTRLLEYADSVNKERGIEKIGVHYGMNEEEAEEFRKNTESILKIPVRMLKVGSVLGTYAGPRWLGFAIQTRK
jgi:DegV family protein with EDD domain